MKVAFENNSVFGVTLTIEKCYQSFVYETDVSFALLLTLINHLEDFESKDDWHQTW